MDEKKYSYILKRMRRKSIKMLINNDAQIEVYAPLRVSKKVIDEFVLKNSEWIEKHIAAVVERNNALRESASVVRFLGKEYNISYWNDRQISFDDKKLYMYDYGDSDKQKKAITGWYRAQAKALLSKRTEFWAGKLNMKYNEIGVSSARKRWGSCNSRRNISFSWRLILARPSAIDYVIVHELVHLIYLNHSVLFWNEVERILPEYKKEEEYLKNLQSWMLANGWNE